MSKRDATQELVQIYKQARERILQNIEKLIESGGNDFYQRQLLMLVDQELERLARSNNKWASEALKHAFSLGAKQAANEAGVALSGAINFVQINRKAIELLAYSMVSDLNAELRNVGRRINDIIADIGIRASAEALGMSSPSSTKQFIIDELQKKDVLSVVYRNGRVVPIDVYAAMVARTTTHEASATAKIEYAKTNGYDLVQISTHYPTCDLCAQFQGRVYSISGKDRRFPPLSKAFYRGYNIIHPNCRHVLTIWVEELHTSEEIDREVRNSTRPFSDNRNERERERYAMQQAKNRQLYNDKKQYDRIRSIVDNPPSRRQVTAWKREYRRQRDAGRELSGSALKYKNLLKQCNSQKNRW